MTTTDTVVVEGSTPGEFFGLSGHHKPTDLLREMADHWNLDLGELIGDPPGTTALRNAINQITVGWWRIEDQTDPDTWSDDTNDLTNADPEQWPYEWERIYFPCDQDHPDAQPATYWQE